MATNFQEKNTNRRTGRTQSRHDQRRQRAARSARSAHGGAFGKVHPDAASFMAIGTTREGYYEGVAEQARKDKNND